MDLARTVPSAVGGGRPPRPRRGFVPSRRGFVPRRRGVFAVLALAALALGSCTDGNAADTDTLFDVPIRIVPRFSASQAASAGAIDVIRLTVKNATSGEVLATQETQVETAEQPQLHKIEWRDGKKINYCRA